MVATTGMTGQASQASGFSGSAAEATDATDAALAELRDVRRVAELVADDKGYMLAGDEASRAKELVAAIGRVETRLTQGRMHMAVAASAMLAAASSVEPPAEVAGLASRLVTPRQRDERRKASSHAAEGAADGATPWLAYGACQCSACRAARRRQAEADGIGVTNRAG